MNIIVTKSEWHSVERREQATLNIDVLREIYPDSDLEELEQLLQDIADGNEEALEAVVEDDWGNGYLAFDYVDDDWWTMRKGGYEVTYETTIEKE